MAFVDPSSIGDFDIRDLTSGEFTPPLHDDVLLSAFRRFASDSNTPPPPVVEFPPIIDVPIVRNFFSLDDSLNYRLQKLLGQPLIWFGYPAPGLTPLTITLVDSAFDIEGDKKAEHFPIVFDSITYDNGTDLDASDTWLSAGTDSVIYSVSITRGVQTSQSTSVSIQVPVVGIGASQGDQVGTSLSSTTTQSTTVGRTIQKSVLVNVPRRKRVVATLFLTPLHHAIPFKGIAHISGSCIGRAQQSPWYKGGPIGTIFRNDPPSAFKIDDPAYGQQITVIDDNTIQVAVMGLLKQRQENH